MREELLHFIWENQYFNKESLVSICGKKLQICFPGIYNARDSGPDFSEADLLIEDIKWVGQVEIHIKSSDWLKHGHQNDLAYANVILHVVYEYDKSVLDQNGKEILTLELKELIPQEFMATAETLYNQSDPIACRSLLHIVPDVKIYNWLDRLAVERLEEKCEFVSQRLRQNKGNWEQTYIDVLFNYMGFKVNNEAFLMLAQRVDWKWLQKNAGKLDLLQACFYGLAGFLTEGSSDRYEKALWDEFQVLIYMHKWKPMPTVMWKFSRMRPSNYPTLRIAQICALFHKHTQLFPAMLYCENMTEFYAYFDVEYPAYWQKHYSFGKASARKRLRPGKASIHLLLINVITPILYAYGKYTNNEIYCERAIELWQELPPEKNRITALWKDTNVRAENAWDSQALIRLYQNHCKTRNCLECQIGRAILREEAARYSLSASNVIES